MKFASTFLFIILCFELNAQIDNNNLLFWESIDNRISDLKFVIAKKPLKESSNTGLGINEIGNLNSFSFKNSFIYSNMLFDSVTSINDSINSRSFYIFKNEGVIFDLGIILSYSTDSWLDFSTNLFGLLIVFDRNSNFIYILHIKDLFKMEMYANDYDKEIPPAPQDMGHRIYTVNTQLKASDLLFIVSIDKELEPLSRLNFCNGQLVSFSEIIKDEDYSEKIEIYPCSNGENIMNITFGTLERILNYGSQNDCNCKMAGTMEKDNVSKPYWIGLSRRYK